MKGKIAICAVVTIAALVVGASVQAQFGGGWRPPSFSGVWAPVVGAGAVYQMEGGQGKQEYTIAIVGEESVGGKTGHWLEMVMEIPNQGRMVVKNLTVVENGKMETKKRIMQMGDQPPMIMPLEGMMAQMGGATKDSADIRADSVNLGTESITTPAGTFNCEHLASKDRLNNYWMSSNVSPFGIVKTTTRNTSMTLIRVLSNAKTQIRGTPVPFDPMQMMQMGKRPPN